MEVLLAKNVTKFSLDSINSASLIGVLDRLNLSAREISSIADPAASFSDKISSLNIS
ncbi:MAG: hypothetical protein OFPII_23890 [Osedax symbiont Rs1]|nr:MAG: hypothetical protein OFPII_23890 [Osedax symbiont Rs1]